MPRQSIDKRGLDRTIADQISPKRGDQKYRLSGKCIRVQDPLSEHQAVFTKMEIVEPNDDHAFACESLEQLDVHGVSFD
jgi:hypothetical protein